MNKTEMLEGAARAIGRLTYDGKPDIGYDGDKPWNPLDDDGDAFRLALKLHIRIEYWPEQDSVLCTLPGSMGATTVGAIGDLELRDAIVRAAVEYSRHMESKPC